MTMLEKMARAAAFAGTGSYMGTPDDLWSWMEPEQRDGVTRIVRAALEAMREPTRDVLQKGITAIEDAHDSTTDSYETYLVTDGADYALPGWTAMIDAILTGEA